MGLLDRILEIPIPILDHWLYFIILFAAIFEAVPLVGFFIPGQVIVALGGFMFRLGILKLWELIFVAVIGAIIGDLVGYVIGRKYGDSLILKYGKHVYFKKEHYLKTKKMMKEHAGKTLVLGRFTSLTRAFAPFIAGANRMKVSKFLMYNVIGAVLWALTFIFVGYIFGESYKMGVKYVGASIIGIIVLLIAGFVIYGIVRKKMKNAKKYK